MYYYVLVCSKLYFHTYLIAISLLNVRLLGESHAGMIIETEGKGGREDEGWGRGEAVETSSHAAS